MADDATWRPDDAARQLCAGLAHDLTNFLGGVIGYGEIFREWLAETGADAEMRERMAVLLASAERQEHQVVRLRLLAGRFAIRGEDHTPAELWRRLREDAGTPRLLPEPDPAPVLLLPGPVPVLAEALRGCAGLATEATATIACRLERDGGTAAVFSLRLPGAAVPAADLPRLVLPYWAQRHLGRRDGLGPAVAAAVAGHLGGALELVVDGDDLLVHLQLPVVERCDG